MAKRRKPYKKKNFYWDIFLFFLTGSVWIYWIPLREVWLRLD